MTASSSISLAYSCQSLVVSSPQIWNSETGEELIACTDPKIEYDIAKLALSGADQRIMALYESRSFTVSITVK